MVELVSKKVFSSLVHGIEHKSIEDVEELPGIFLIKKARKLLTLSS